MRTPATLEIKPAPFLNLLSVPAGWSSLQNIPGLVAVASVWQAAWQDQFEAFKSLCLRPATWFVSSVSCPLHCGCFHSVILRHDRTGAIGACRCEPASCPDIILTLEEITPLQLDLCRLARAIGAALGLETAVHEFLLPNTVSIASGKARSLPAILTIQSDRMLFRRVVADLILLVSQPFVLFAPTSLHLDSSSKSRLRLHHCRFYPIDSCFDLNSQGALQPLRPPAAVLASC